MKQTESRAHSAKTALGISVAAIALLSYARVTAGGAFDLVLHDVSRHREVPLKVYWPQEQGARPLIVFSPGFGGDRDGYAYLGRAWSETGFVVVVLTHLGSDRDAVRRYGASLARDVRASYELQIERTGDVAYVLNSLDVIERAPLAGRIDRARIGVAGHSMGAGTALLLAGARAAAPGHPLKVFRDDRIRAAIAMSPQGSGEEGFSDGSWSDVRVPVMTMSGTLDGGIGGQPPSWRLEAFQHMPPPNKFQVIVTGARHLSFATGDAFHPCIVRETTAFWNAFLKSDATDLEMASVGACTVNSK